MGKRLLGEHFKRNGDPKHPFATKAEAEDEAYRSLKQVYRCRMCGAYHTGGYRPREAFPERVETE